MVICYFLHSGSRKTSVYSGRRRKACRPCRCSGSGKLAVPGFPYGRLPYWTDRRLFAIPGSQAPFRDVRVPESCVLPETRDRPAFLRSHTVRGGTPFPSCFRQYPHIFPVCPAYRVPAEISRQTGISDFLPFVHVRRQRRKPGKACVYSAGDSREEGSRALPA